MHPDVERLKALMPPGPEDGDQVDWQAVEQDLGCRLPADFRDLIANYGVGTIDECLMVLPPTSAEHDSGIPSVGQMTPTAEKIAWLEHTKSEYPLWPAPGALLCGLRMVDINGDLAGAVYWCTTGPVPEQWPVVVWQRYRPFVEFELSMTGLLVKWLAESADIEFDQRMVFGAPHSRFIHWRAERAMREQGLDPWEYLEPLHLEANEEWEERNLTGTRPSWALAHEANIRPSAPESLPRPEGPQLTVLGVNGQSSGDLVVKASVALGSSTAAPIQLTPPLGPQGPVLEFTGPEGLLAVAFGAEVTAPEPGTPLVVSATQPLTFEARVPQSAILTDATWPDVVRRLTTDTTMKLVVQDPAMADLRAATSAEADDVIVGWWPPQG
ncbi:SMI1/KNR4 family protein [Kitasatospora nipponensis]|uniref:SMI1/KNR4 family protein n=1 Tax=Kitasatospora nipponensis TaxID=258049 RepID=UPI0031E0AE9A